MEVAKNVLKVDDSLLALMEMLPRPEQDIIDTLLQHYNESLHKQISLCLARTNFMLKAKVSNEQEIVNVILTAVCNHYVIVEKELLRQCRKSEFVKRKTVTMYLLCRAGLTNLKSGQILGYNERNAHSMTYHHINLVRDAFDKTNAAYNSPHNIELRRDIEALEQEISKMVRLRDIL